MYLFPGVCTCVFMLYQLSEINCVIIIDILSDTALAWLYILLLFHILHISHTWLIEMSVNTIKLFTQRVLLDTRTPYSVHLFYTLKRIYVPQWIWYQVWASFADRVIAADIIVVFQQITSMLESYYSLEIPEEFFWYPQNIGL